ncbi:MAG TPA: hypothetical protein DC054_01645 [Blastocatellia bacterium]|nr:hypothetical protein [Blastocatellia bacterium]
MDYSDNILGGSDTVLIGGAKAATAPEDVLIGIRLDDRFLIERKLGRGSYGTVYLASDEKLRPRKVVVKVMRGESLQNEWALRTFEREIEALIKIDHPGVVGVFDTGKIPDGKPYIVMEYVDGVSLRSLITPEGMQFEQVARIVREMGSALSAAHRVKVWHRDLKPENVMLKRLNEVDQQVKIIDFGVAKVTNSLIPLSTAQGQIVGTIGYMSPEQLSSQELTPATDIYSMGVVAYEMLTGRIPIDPVSAFQILDLQRLGISKPTEFRPDLPPAVDSIIFKALSFEPRDRYESARDFGDLLSTALLGKDEPNEVNAKPGRPIEVGGATLYPEVAHVLFMDLVGYSRLMLDDQRDRIHELQEIVRHTNAFKDAELAGKLLSLPTGDGMALSFFSDPETHVRCAVEIGKALREHPKLKLRIGINTGLVYRINDINENLNVNGGGINLAQRVMDCGDAGHILLSGNVAVQLRELRLWKENLHYLRTVKVKHGEQVDIWNLYNQQIGNSEIPSKLRPRWGRLWLIATAALVLMIGGLVWALRPPVRPPVPPELVLTYFLMPTDRINAGSEERFAGNEIFRNGSKFTFVLIPERTGSLYLLDRGSGRNGRPALNVLFPTLKKNNGSSVAAANQRLEVGIHFDDYSGDENLSIIWSSQTVPELDEIFHAAATTDWEIKNQDQIKIVTEFLNQHQSPPPKVEIDSNKKQTTVNGQGDTFMSTVVLKHRDF